MDHARSDLKLARLAAGDVEVRREQACFHAQQAAEKSIKAVLLFKAVAFPLSHDIEQLLETAQEAGVDPPGAVQDASLLTPYAVATRYPGSSSEVTEADLDEAIRVAETTVAWATGMLSATPA